MKTFIAVIVSVIIGLIIVSVASLVTALMFMAGNHLSMVQPIFERLGIANLSYMDYWIGSIVLSGILTGLLAGVGNNKG